ncbi:MAG TPA: hypothetical protein VJH91_03880 [Candidatus Paceibacterota bacterium]
MKQVVISEISKPDDIRKWLAVGLREEAVVVAKEPTDIVRKCVAMARSHKLSVTFHDDSVARELAG